MCIVCSLNSCSVCLLYIKDTVIYERLDDKQMYKDITIQHLEEFATLG